MINYEFKEFITNQESITTELKKVIDLKSMRELTTDEFAQIIIRYYRNYKELLFDEIDENKIKLKGTPHTRLGKKRIKMIYTCFEKMKIAVVEDQNKGILKIIEKI